eukprot:TRINITY_DN6506_c0_g1_i2.p1 TRINITY_DN6506_c0_g1~~TRINITY_DN6506_c0_g1_i2.p1  ORF type:complete len:429 (-),score=96.94 TRINITY_DN6506_c0_g1_i2:99-1385(-)
MKRSLEESNLGEPSSKKRKVDQNDPVFAYSEPVEYHCDYCRKDISLTLRVRCADCGEFDLCIECFSAGAELKDHKNNHSYRIIDNLHFPLMVENWSADEEILLLEGLEKFGYGNWVEISDYVSTKSKIECRVHYEQYYINSKHWPQPDYGEIIATRENVKKLNSGRYPIPPVPKSQTKTTIKKPAKVINPVRSDLSNYMPARKEFDLEWNSDMENIVCDIGFEDDDTPEDRDIKVQLWKIYNYKLGLRKKYKEFVLERNLHDIKEQDRLKRSRGKTEKKLHEQLKRYLHILSPQEYEVFLKGLSQEEYLKERIKKLQHWRKMGIKDLKGGDIYDKERKKRDSFRNNRREKSRKRKSKNKPLSVNNAPGVDLLSPTEQQLCSSLHIMPEPYLLVKERLIRENIQEGKVNLVSAKNILHLGMHIDYCHTN